MGAVDLRARVLEVLKVLVVVLMVVVVFNGCCCIRVCSLHCLRVLVMLNENRLHLGACHQVVVLLTC